MIKSFLILIIFPIFLFSSQQIILVVADDFNTSHAKLEFYEGNKLLLATEVNIGKNGLGWGLGEYKLHQNPNEPLKYEGDNKAPAGVFALSDIFGYASESNVSLPYLYTSKELICVDDSNSHFYNNIIEANGDEKSFEYMKRKDNQYEIGVVVAHNKKALASRGSCIFLHIEKFKGAGTAGCTSMQYKDLNRIVHTLNRTKNPILIQIPKSSSQEILKHFSNLKESQLLLKISPY